MKSSSIGEFLKFEFAELRKKNSRVSLRSFAKKAGIPAGRMSELLANQRGLSDYYAHKISIGLSLNADKKQELFSFISTTSKKSFDQDLLSDIEITKLNGWLDYAILNLLKLPQFKPTIANLAVRLNVNEESIEESLRNLTQLKLVQIENSEVRLSMRQISTSFNYDTPTARSSIREIASQLVSHIDSLATENVEINSTILAVDSQNIDQAKKLIDQFRKNIGRLLTKGTPETLYCLNLQLYPIETSSSVDRR